MSESIGISFIGGGNMAGAIINAIIKSSVVSPHSISLFDPSEQKCAEFKKMGVNIASSNTELSEKDDVLILAVKPQAMDNVLAEISGKLRSRCIVSIAAGISTEHIKAFIGKDIPVVRALPNTPMLALEGMTVIAESHDTPEDIFRFIVSVFKAAGEVVILPENKINEAIPMSSSSPAFFFRMLDAMAMSGERFGISYDDAFKLSAAAMYGSAKYAMLSDRTPKELIRQVSSPGGTTVAALTAFDDFNFEKLIDEAVERCINRAYELGNSKK